VTDSAAPGSSHPFARDIRQAGRMTAEDDWNAYARALGANLHRAREAAGLTQERVAHAAGISTFTYQKLEKGESNPGTPANPRLQTLVSLAEVLGITPAELLPASSPRAGRPAVRGAGSRA
jgi:DNA-binding XRE family transcriptional regulator